jgi:mono/diheme cytochrome c family protein
MNPEPTQLQPAAPEAPRPTAERRPVPVWLFVLFFILLYWAMFYFDQRSAWGNQYVYAPYHSYAQLETFQVGAGGGNALGKQLFDNVCALCHNTDGSGKPGQAPPFIGSEWAEGPPARMIRIPLAGLTGPITVHGQEYNLTSMPAMGAGLTDEQLAAVLTYIRQSFGNKASEITPEQVKAVRAQVGNRTQPWTVPELQSVQ